MGNSQGFAGGLEFWIIKFSKIKKVSGDVHTFYTVSGQPSFTLHLAKDILRYKEIHGEKPTDTQMTAMAQISKELDGKVYSHSVKEYQSHEIDFLYRKEGDLLFRQMCSHHELPSFHKLDPIQTQEKASLDSIIVHITHDLSPMNQKEFSL